MQNEYHMFGLQCATPAGSRTLPQLVKIDCPTPPNGGGCVCGKDRCVTNYGWDAMHPSLRIGKADLMPDQGKAREGCRSVEIRLRPTAHQFRQGQRIRFALALADFPRLWPAPLAGEISLTCTGDNMPRLLLPRTAPLSSPAPELPPPVEGVRSALELASSPSWRVCRELVQQAATLEIRSVSTYRLRDSGTVNYRHEYTASVLAAEPAGAAIDCSSSVEVRRNSSVILVKTVSHFTAEKVTVRVEVEQNGAITFQRQWERARVEGSA